MAKPIPLVCGIVAASLLLTGCLTTPDTRDEDDGVETAKDTIEIMYAFSGDQSVAFQEDMTAWADENGLTIDFIQSDAFEEIISTKVSSGDAPDIAIFPQPGILKTMASADKLAELDTQVDMASLESQLGEGYLTAGTVDGVTYGAPMGMNGKSFYWYNKIAFEAAGYEVPETHEELLALIDQIKADGVAPLCYGMESGSATGWPATDWIEDYVLQTNGVEVYDQWVDGEIKFNSDEVRDSMAIYNEVLMTEGNVYGGIQNSSANAFAQALNPMFDEEPKCYMGKQGNFITQPGFFPDEIANNIDENVGMFITPSVEGENPMLGGGDIAAAFTKNDANVKKAMAFMTTDPEFGKAQAQTGAWLSPLKTFDVEQYPNETLKEVVAIMQDDETVFRFDASDQMPGIVGSTAFWQSMTSYTSGNIDETTALDDIDDAWPVQ